MARIAGAFLLLLALSGIAQAAPNGSVVLFTDYGVDSLYVGILKGVILGKAPQVRVDSLTNAVPPLNVETGAYMLAEGCAFFPMGTVFCCVVDPGVGGARKGIALETLKGQYFVAPDNGLLTLIAQRDGIREIYETKNTALWRDGDLSSTFHGRDIFGPVAAAIASGVSLKEVGPKVHDLTMLPLAVASVEDGVARGQVTRVDEYGNLITNIPGSMLTDTLGAPLGEALAVTVGSQTIAAKLVKTYSDVAKGEHLVLVQSSGYVECAINLGNLGLSIGAKPHDAVSIHPSPASQSAP